MLPRIGVFKAHSSHTREADLQVETGANITHRFVEDTDMLDQKWQRLIDQHVFDSINGLRGQSDLVMQPAFAAL